MTNCFHRDLNFPFFQLLLLAMTNQMTIETSLILKVENINKRVSLSVSDGDQKGSCTRTSVLLDT